MTKARVRFQNFKRLEERLIALGPMAREPLFGAVKDGAQHVENRAKQGIAQPPKTGRFYKRGKGVVHQASAPGEYPAADTGNLMRSIRHEPVKETETKIEIEVAAHTKYAKPLEYKPPERGGRPFLRRALDETKDEIEGDAYMRLDAVLRNLRNGPR